MCLVIVPPYYYNTIGTIGYYNRNNRLARSLITLIGSCRIYYVFKIKAGSFRSAMAEGGGGGE